MLLKVLLVAVSLFVGAAGLMRASVLLESYALLAGGVALSLAAVAVAHRAAPRPVTG